MTGTFEKGDVIWVKIANEKRISKLKVGDIITFTDPAISETIAQFGGEDDGTNLNTHRIVDIVTMPDGSLRYVCQGDYVKISFPSEVYDSDKDSNSKIQIVTEDNIKAVYTRNMSKGLTNVLKFAKSSLGFGLCIVLPTAILLVYEVVMLIRNIMKLNNEKMAAKMAEDKAAQQEDLELQKQRMREELLAELKAEQEKGKQAEEVVEEEKKEDQTE